MLKKVVFIASSIVASYSAQATDQSAGENNVFTGFRYCGGTPQSPSFGSAEQIQSDYQSKMFAIIQGGYESTPDKNSEEFEIMRQEAHSISYKLIPILFPTHDIFKNGASFTQLCLTERECRLDFTNTLLIDLKNLNNIKRKRDYLKGMMSFLSTGIDLKQNERAQNSF